MNEEDQFILILAFGLPIAGGFLCIIVSWILAYSGGWATLAESFRTHHRPIGAAISWCSLHFEPFTSYRRCIQVTLCDEGIFMIPILLFRFAHPAVLIPWSNVGKARKSDWLDAHIVLPIEVRDQSLELCLPVSAQPWIEKWIVLSGPEIDRGSAK